MNIISAFQNIAKSDRNMTGMPFLLLIHSWEINQWLTLWMNLRIFIIHYFCLHLKSTVSICIWYQRFLFTTFLLYLYTIDQEGNHILSIPVDLRPSVYQIKFIIFPLCGLRPLDNQITESNLSVFVNRTKSTTFTHISYFYCSLRINSGGEGEAIKNPLGIAPHHVRIIWLYVKPLPCSLTTIANWFPQCMNKYKWPQSLWKVDNGTYKPVWGSQCIHLSHPLVQDSLGSACWNRPR